MTFFLKIPEGQTVTEGLVAVMLRPAVGGMNGTDHSHLCSVPPDESCTRVTSSSTHLASRCCSFGLLQNCRNVMTQSDGLAESERTLVIYSCVTLPGLQI